MKKLTTLILFLAVTQICFGQLDNATKNKIKVMYLSADNFYKSNDYTKTLNEIDKIESLSKGLKLATAQNLKVKSLIGLNRFKEAQKELEVLYNLNPSKDILTDIAQYSSVIESGIESENIATKKQKEEADRRAILSKELREKANYGKTVRAKPNGYGLVTENGSVGFVDGEGNVMVPVKYAFCSDAKEDNAIMYQHNDNESLYKADKLVVANYKSISFQSYSNNIVKADTNEGWALYSIRDEKWILTGVSIINGCTNGVLKYYKAYSDFNDENPSYLNITDYL